MLGFHAFEFIRGKGVYPVSLLFFSYAGEALDAQH